MKGGDEPPSLSKTSSLMVGTYAPVNKPNESDGIIPKKQIKRELVGKKEGIGAAKTECNEGCEHKIYLYICTNIILKC